ncbi:MAG: cell division protein ZipA [Candidatus Thiodiazotropha sp.]
MDATTLRIVLFVAGLFFLGGIYFYETRRRKRESAQARRRVAPKVEPRLTEEVEEDLEPESEPRFEEVVESSDAFEDESQDEITELLGDEDDEDEERIDSFRIDDEPIPGIDQPVKTADEGETPDERKPEPGPGMEQQDLFGFSAQEESPVDVPDLIIQINVRAKKAPFAGPAIEKAMQETGMVLSDMAIYQRLASDGSRKVLYNLASMVEPGVFPAKAMADFTTPGLTLFAQLPGPGDSMMIFSDMLYTAERLAAMLVGDLQDDSHSALTKQTIEHLRERIMEHKRQIQLARRKG